MALEFVAVGILCGVAMAEIPARFLRMDRVGARLRRIAADLRSFRQATDDAVRQVLATRSGSSILALGLQALVIILAMAGVAFLGLRALSEDLNDPTGYFVTVSIAAAGWWSLRGRMRAHSNDHRVEGRTS